MKQSRLYSDTLEAADGEIMQSNPVSAESQSNYSIHDAYNDWLAHLPDFEDEYKDKYGLRNDSSIWKIRDQKHKEALFLADRANYDAEDLQTFLNGDWALNWRDEINSASDTSEDNYEDDVSHSIFASAFLDVLGKEEISIPAVEVSGIGYRNTADIKVDGDVNAADFCSCMSEGRVIVEGDVNKVFGVDMSGGEIEIRGDADMILGNKGSSEITVEGDLTTYLGTGGTTKVSGSLEQIANAATAGEVYVEGEIEEIGQQVPEEVTVYQKQEGNWIEVSPGDSQ